MADGKGAVWYKRDARKFRALAAEAAELHRRALLAWPKLAAEYKAALPRVTSMQAWADTFGVDLSQDPRPSEEPGPSEDPQRD